VLRTIRGVGDSLLRSGKGEGSIFLVGCGGGRKTEEGGGEGGARVLFWFEVESPRKKVTPAWGKMAVWGAGVLGEGSRGGSILLCRSEGVQKCFVDVLWSKGEKPRLARGWSLNNDTLLTAQ